MSLIPLRWLVVAALLSLWFSSSAPAQQRPEKTPARSFVGVLEGAPRSGRIAVVVQSGRFLVYLCSQDADFNRGHARWFQGDLGPGGDFRAVSDGLELRGSVSDEKVIGSVAGPDGKALRFSAARVPAHGDAGLYRSETKADGTAFVAGWIIDLDDNVAGSVSCHGRQRVVVTPRPAPPGRNLSSRAPEVPPQVANQLNQGGNIRKLNTPSTTPPVLPGEGEGRGVKIDETAREETLRDGVARVKERGGSPLLAVFLHQARRRLAGVQPVGPQEERLFERLAELPPEVLKQVVANFDQLPLADRDALLGPLGKTLTPDNPLDGKALEALSGALAARSAKKPPRGPGEGGVKELRLGQLVCVRETPPAGVGSDDVLLVLIAASGRTLHVRVSDPLRGLDTDVTKVLPEADGRAWPPPDGKVATEEVVLSAALIEDDSGDPAATAALCRVYAAVTAEAAGAVSGGLLDFDLTDPLTAGFAALMALQPKTVFLGSDRIIAQGARIAGADGKPRDRLTIKQLRPDGAVKTQYELRGLKAVP
jgi:hypothetical protein